jgi:hypothetical protein
MLVPRDHFYRYLDATLDLSFHLDEPLPDHSSLSRIRQRLGLPLFRRNEKHHTHTLDGILANQAFHDALNDAEMSISTPSGVSKLIREYKESEGLGTRSRGRPRQD